jgi:hypothetical protein
VWLLLPILVAGVWTALIYQRPAEVTIDFEGAYEEPFISGFHGRERAGGRAFRWTTGESYIRLKNLPRGKLDVEARLRVVRPSGSELPLVWFSANGVTVYRTRGRPGIDSYSFNFPSRSTAIRLGVHSDTFIAGGGRALGIQVLWLKVSSAERTGPAAGPIAWMVLASLVLLLSFRWVGLRLPYASLAAMGFTVAFIYLVLQGGMRFSDYPQQVAFTAVVALVATSILRFLLRKESDPKRRTVLLAVAVMGLLFKWGAVSYPLMVTSDEDFHGNRLSEALAGNFHTTSVSQHDPPFRIPYPVSLYVVAVPLVKAGVERVAAIQAVTAAADVLVGVVLVLLAGRFLNDQRAGILAAVVYQFVPLNFLTFSAGNFTNLFGVATTVFFLAFLIAGMEGGSYRVALGAFAFSTLALTSHFSTFLIGLLLWPLGWMAIFGLSPLPLRPRHTRLLAAAVGLSLVLVILYYAGYWELVASQWGRAVRPEYASGETELAGPLAKLAFNLAFYKEQLGIVFGLLAFLGALSVLRQPEVSPLQALSLAWVAVTGAFFILDLTTAVEVRYVLQILPLLALFAGRYLSEAFDRGRKGRVVAVVLLGYIVWLGTTNIFDCLLFRYH